MRDSNRPKWYECRCSQCRKTLRGFKDASRETVRRHERADEKRAEEKKKIDLARAAARINPARDPTPPDLPAIPMPIPPVPQYEHRQATPQPIGSVAASRFGSPLGQDGSAPISTSPATPASPDLPGHASPHIESRANSPRPQSPNPQQLDPSEVYYLPSEDPALFEPPIACSEPPHIRIAYLTAVSSYILDRAPRERAELGLRASMAAYRTLNAIPAYPKPATSLSAVLRRLGLDADPYLTQRPMCSVCYCIYGFDYITSARSPVCRRQGCKGIVWEAVAGQRKPLRVAAYGNVLSELRRMFMRPDFIASIRLASQLHEKNSALAHPILRDIYDGTAWSMNAFGLERTVALDGTVSDVVSRPEQRISLGFGLFASVNIDWFKITDKYSVGGIYLSILNLERSVRNHPWNVILACTIPGPGEPSLEDLNHVLQPIVEEFKQLYSGVTIRVYEQILPGHVESRLETVALKVHMSNNDSPACQKITGTAAHNSAQHFCICQLPRSDLNTPKGYDIESFVLRDDWGAIQLAYNIRGAEKEERNKFASTHGVRWSAMNELPGWMTYSSAPLDLMHNLYLGIVRHLWNSVIISGYMFTASEKASFESFLDDIQWPSSAGRVPKGLTKVSTKKADEWRRLSAVLPVALWFVWRNHVDEIPPGAPRIPRDAKSPPTFTRCRKELLDVALLLCAAVQLFSAWSISLLDVHCAQVFLQQYCLGLLRLKIHLAPNHHWSMHYEPIFKRFGPACAWWVYAFERYNGLLQKVNLNHHQGQMEATLMRFWIRLHRLYELAQFLPESASDAERDLLRGICNEYGYRGTANSTRTAGTALGPDLVAGTHTKTSPIDLRKLPHHDIYPLILRFAQETWPELNLQHDLSVDSSGPALWSDRCAHSLPSVTKGGVRYGCATSKRSSRDQNAFVLLGGESVPARLLYHFELAIPSQAPFICLVFQRFIYDERIPTFPWDLYAVDLGIYVSHADMLGTPEVIASSKIQAPLALCTVKLKRQPQLWVWISISYDKDGVDDFREDDEGHESGEENQ